MPTTSLPLTGKIALIAGATRGAGRGIATELGALGATVICTGRSTRASQSDLNRPETIEDTAELVTAAGGVGVALRSQRRGAGGGPDDTGSGGIRWPRHPDQRHLGRRIADGMGQKGLGTRPE
ncbi:hypothetical protein [Deinococcus sp. QL22]|uniref:hypothetical protein n=1 Tax=Deinococcus sp. QL22 TaxID=2939437 RepID=UPI002017C759|nr:hypothetical protein [Deinococcus sp. QL22]UQN07115.1 hypothetical protein M1R55_04170 [Deinococcus sp. QL22]